jgi:hypothetical protein
VANPNPSPATRFKPKWKGGPGGYPPRRRITDALAELIEEKDAYRAIAALWLKEMLGGDFRYVKEAVDRLEGKVADKIEERKEVIVKRRDRRPGRNGHGGGDGDGSPPGPPPPDAGAGEG